jgi:hypothetical protein
MVLQLNMTTTIQENISPGLQRESFASIWAMTIPMPETQGHVPPTSHFIEPIRDKGRLEIPGSLFRMPSQDFILTFTPGGDVIENEPKNAWPKIRFELSPSPGQTNLRVNILLRPSEDTVEAEVLYTRVWYTLVKAGECSFHSTGINFPLRLRIEAETSDEVNKVLYRAKLYRKLAFLQNIFRRNFQLPRYIPAEEMRKIEIVFRGITEGEFATRASDITFVDVIPSELNLNAPPFSQPGPFSRVVGDKENLFGHWLDLGEINVRLNHAELANPRELKRIAEAPNQPVNLRFIVPDHQIIHRFSSYAAMPKKRRIRRLDEFIRSLNQDEPPELANTVKDLLVSDVSAESAIQIASDWLMLNRLPDRLSAQTPEIDQATGYWRVPLYLVYSGGDHGLVGDVYIDIKTGEVIKATPIDELLERAQDLSERIIHAR